MALLAIDTSSVFTSIALATESMSLGETLYSPTSHDSELHTLVENCIARFGTNPDALRGIVVGAGPGSFTGLRISLAFSKGMAAALNIPLAVRPSFPAYALEFCERADRIVVLGDARRKEVFVQSFRTATGQGLSEVQGSPEILPIDLLQQRFADRDQDSIFWVSPEAIDGVPFKTAPPSKVAESLISLYLADPDSAVSAYSAEAVAALKPMYIREVAARKISER